MDLAAALFLARARERRCDESLEHVVDTSRPLPPRAALGYRSDEVERVIPAVDKAAPERLPSSSDVQLILFSNYT
jgi:hypothetical protein